MTTDSFTVDGGIDGIEAMRAAVKARRGVIEAQAEASAKAAPKASSGPARPGVGYRGGDVTVPVDFALDCLGMNRVGDAMLFTALFRDKYRYVWEWDKWLVWNGVHWEIDQIAQKATADIERVCEVYVNAYAASGRDGEDPLYKTLMRRLNTLRGGAGRKELLFCVTTIDNPPVVSAEELDMQPNLLAMRNAVIDLRTGEAIPPKQDQLLLNACPTEWTGIATPAPRFRKYLLDCMDGDDSMVDFIVKLLGYSLFGEKPLHVWAIMYGPLSRNGKDTLMNTIRNVLGPKLHIKVDIRLFIEEKMPRSASQADPALLSLRGSRLAYASEAARNMKLDQAKIKDMTGGAYVTARGINEKQMITWKQSALLVMLTNYLPKIETDDDGFRARTLIVEWPVKFVEEPQNPWEKPIDRNMERKLKEEASGILAELVRGAMDVAANGLDVPDKVKKFTSEQILDQDDIGKFIEQCCIIEETPTGGRKYETEIAVSKFAEVGNWWLGKNEGNTYSYRPKKYTEALKRRGILTHKSSIMYYQGIDIRPEVMTDYYADLGSKK